MARQDILVVEKLRYRRASNGERLAEHVFYACGPRRHTLEEALHDADRMEDTLIEGDPKREIPWPA
jgi:hypothetical protein